MAACIISTAQQASPNVSGHKEPALAQEMTESSLVEIHSSFINKKLKVEYCSLLKLNFKKLYVEIF